MRLLKKKRILFMLLSAGLLLGNGAKPLVCTAAESVGVVEQTNDTVLTGEEAPADRDVDRTFDETQDKETDEFFNKEINGSPDIIFEEKTVEAFDEIPEEGEDEITNDTTDGNLDDFGGGESKESIDEKADIFQDDALEEENHESADEVTDKTINESSDNVLKSALGNVVGQASGLSLKVEYPTSIQCGTPVTFTLKAEGGSGNYKYRIYSLMIYDGSEDVSVYDVSYGTNSEYSNSNTFTFTFYASGTYYIRFSAMDMGIKPYQTVNTGMREHKLEIQDADYPSVEQIVSDTAKQCLKECHTDFEKAVWMHDWILDRAEYDYSYSYCSAEGVLARGVGTCESYHRAYVMLLNKVGITTGRITGNGHVWTAVRMDGKWYQVDSTWNDMGANFKGSWYEHAYFGLTDDIIRFVHSDHTAAVPGYESTALENNYFIKTGEIKRWSDPFAELVTKNLADGKTEFSLSVTDSMPSNYKNVIYNLVAYQLSIQDWGSVDVSASYRDDVIFVKGTVNNVAAYVKRLYRVLLEREADTDGLSAYVDALTNGKLTASGIMLNFTQSSEFVNKRYSNQAYITKLYQAMLGRNAGKAEIAEWVEKLNTGVSRRYIVVQISKSAEFADVCNDCRIKRGDIQVTENRDKNYAVTAYVSRCYQSILGRSADEQGLNTWTGEILSGCGGAEIIKKLVTSTEFMDKRKNNSEFVDILYKAMLGRTADAVGKKDWMNILDKGVSYVYIINGFADSNEFRELCAQYGMMAGKATIIEARDKNIGVTSFVMRNYKTILGRNADIRGLNDWCDRILNRTFTPANVAYEFVFSKEFVNKHMSNAEYVEILYKAFLNRSSDPQGKRDWIKKLSDGKTREEVFWGFANSWEFRNIVAGYGL